jgi:hypothetical protein
MTFSDIIITASHSSEQNDFVYQNIVSVFCDITASFADSVEVFQSVQSLIYILPSRVLHRANSELRGRLSELVSVSLSNDKYINMFHGKLIFVRDHFIWGLTLIKLDELFSGKRFDADSKYFEETILSSISSLRMNSNASATALLNIYTRCSCTDINMMIMIKRALIQLLNENNDAVDNASTTSLVKFANEDIAVLKRLQRIPGTTGINAKCFLVCGNYSLSLIQNNNYYFIFKMLPMIAKTKMQPRVYAQKRAVIAKIGSLRHWMSYLFG